MTKFLTCLFSGAALVAALATPAFAADPDLTESVASDYDYVLDLYKHFHENPELSLKEKNTASRLAKELSALGFDVTERVGDDWVQKKIKKDVGTIYEDVGGYGVVAVLKNGDGPTVMLRADMDALPLEEKTGLPYESQVMQQSYRGEDVPVMHACAHDSQFHFACLVTHVCFLFAESFPVVFLAVKAFFATGSAPMPCSLA